MDTAYYNGMSTGITRGFYLVLPSEKRHFIGEDIHEARRNVDRACDKYLTESTGWKYWIDYSHGADINGNAAWANIDQQYNVVD